MRAILAILLLLTGAAAAQPTAPSPAQPATTPRSTVTLLSDVAAIAPGQPFRLALDLTMARGWHTYWTNPGDAGGAPDITWTLPEGASATPLQFPTPSRIPYGPLVNFGYTQSLTLLASITPPADARGPFTITADATWLICADICIPEEARFTLTLPVEATARPSTTAARFEAAEAALPRASPFATRAGFQGARGAIEFSGLPPGSVREAFFFPSTQAWLDNAAPQPTTLRDNRLVLPLQTLAAPPAQIEGIIAITDAQGIRAGYTVSVTPGVMPATAPALPWWQAALLAALGGLLLNLMPCVFPVLAMKAVGLARMAGAARAEIRTHAALYAAGVLVAFILIGAAMVGLRAAGSMAGWGFQFTQPIFVAAMAWLMLAVGLNLSGVFVLRGPAMSGQASAFGTGLLAVVVATPCTAPFMAAALGAAMAMSPAATLAVFAALGVGMALPWLLLAAAPGAARALPRPGAWMERLRQALAFPMYGAAAWLVWVLAELSGADGVALGLGGAVLVGFAAWALGAAQSAGGKLGRGAALVALVGALALLPGIGSAPAPAATSNTHEAWSAARVSELHADGRPVFVNLTAAWCITCKVNERVALDTEATRAAFAVRNVALLVGDWTRGDAAITALLREHAREGVPLYLYLFPGAAPVLLPQILTEGIVLRALGG